MLLLARDWLFFAVVVLGGGAALAPRPASTSSALEAWCIGVALALATLSATVFASYVAGLPNTGFALGYLALASAALARRHTVVALLRDPVVRDALFAWLLLTFGCLALLACVSSYSGGLWMGDWEEHYQRPRLFLRLRPEDGEFRRLFTLTARPPLANLADAGLLWPLGADFPRHQTMMALLNSLAFLPAALFARTLGGGRASTAIVALLLLVNPLFVQNATYAWTKLITAFFVLLGLHVLLTGSATRARTVGGFALLGLAVLTHYSACVWLLVFGGAWLLVQRPRWRAPEFRVTLALSAAAFTAVLAPWLVYAVTRYGLVATLASNSTVSTAAHFSWWDNLTSLVPKLWTTLVPHPLRSFDRSLLDQTNAWSHFRDLAFYVYQSNLLFAFGTPALLMLAWLFLRRRTPAAPLPPLPPLWLIAVPLVIVLGTAVHGHTDDWGLAHICLQPLILLGVALASARLPALLRAPHARLLLASLALAALGDFLLGLALHFTATAFALNRAPDETLTAYLDGLSRTAQHNFWQKARLGQDFLADTLTVPPFFALALVALLALLLGRLAWHRHTSAP